MMVVMLALGVLAVAAASCTPAPPTRATPPAIRVAALAPAIAQMLQDMHADDLLVARHGWDRVRTDLPVAGDQSGIDYEALIGARPTHVLLQWGERDLPERLHALAREHGWVVRSFPLLTLSDIQSALAWMHAEVVRPALGERAPPPPDLLGQIDALRSPACARAGRVLLVHNANPDVLGPGSYHHEILERLGGAPAITRGKAFMSLDAEDVLRLNPDAIILIPARDPGTPPLAGGLDAAALRERLGRAGTLDIAAVRSGRIAVIDDPLALSPSTALVGVARRMSEVLAEWGRKAAPEPERAP